MKLDDLSAATNPRFSMTKKPDPTSVEVLPANTGLAGEVVLGEGDERRFARVQLRLAELSKADRERVERIITKHCQSK